MSTTSIPSTHLTEAPAFSLAQASRAYELPPLNTYCMPLCEPIYEWTTFAQQTEQRVPALTAVGHAFFALSHETKALRYFTLACQQQGRIPTDRGYWYTQAGRILQDATHHWSRAACVLDTLTSDELTADDLAEVRAASQQWRQSCQPAVQEVQV